MSQITISKAQAAAIGKLAEGMTGGCSFTAEALTQTAWHEQSKGYEASKDAIIDATSAREDEILGSWRIYPGGRVDALQEDGSYR